MYQYTICDQPDVILFDKQCAVLEKHIPGIVRRKRLEDVDGSLTQLYTLGDAEISVHNSAYIGALYVNSDVELTRFFKQ